MRSVGKGPIFYIRVCSLLVLTTLALTNFSRIASFSFAAKQTSHPIELYLDQTVPPTFRLAGSRPARGDRHSDTPTSQLEETDINPPSVDNDVVEVRLSDEDEDPTRPSWAGAERVAVIVKRNQSRAPLLSIPIVFLPEDLPKLRESRRWLAWIVAHYHHLPEFVAFVHDHGKTYHTLRERIDLIENAKPATVLMVSKKSWKMAGIARDTLQKRWPRSMDLSEKKKLDWVYGFLFDMDFSEAWYKWNMPEYKCCAEMVVSRKAVHRVGLHKFVRILREVEETMDEPWAWVMERTWENLFKYG